MHILIALYVVIVASNGSGLRCGYGYKFNQHIEIPNIAAQGFQQLQCANAQFCTKVTSDPVDYLFLQNVVAEFKFCDAEFGIFGEIFDAKSTCQLLLNGGTGCANYSFNTSSIAGLPSEVSANFCCCKGELCNCDQNSPDSADYCIPEIPTTPFSAQTTTSSHASTQPQLSPLAIASFLFLPLAVTNSLNFS